MAPRQPLESRHTVGVTAPLLGSDSTSAGASRLTLSAAERYEHADDVGSSYSPYVGFEGSPLRGLTLSGSWAEASRPPNLPDRQEIGNTTHLEILRDPQSASGYSTALVENGGNATLRSERARSWTLGLQLAPEVLPGFSTALTYFDVVYRDRITQPLYSSDILSDPTRSWAVFRNVAGTQLTEACSRDTFVGGSGDCTNAHIDVVIDLREHNLATLKTRGIDTGTEYASTAPWGDCQFRLDGTYVLNFAEASSPNTPLIELSNTQNNPLRLQLRGSLSFDEHHFGQTLAARYTGSYRDIASSPNRTVSANTVLDAQLRWKSNSSSSAGLQIALTARNIFNRTPPFLNNPVGVGYDQENADLSGRVLRVSLDKRW